MKELPVFTINDIRALGPCYDPARYLPEDWRGTAADVLAVKDCPVEDRFWVVMREGWIDERTLRLFAAWCARQALALIDNPDSRSIEACNVAERFANGEATQEELAAARDAARAAASDAARAAASDAAWAAARAAARAAASDAAWAAAWDAASAAASDAASDAAWAAAWDAASDAARAAAWDAASDAAWAAARAAQASELLNMLI